MLKRITIDNYALIDHIEVELGRGLTIITGETGAGKSIILGALNLLTGVRADIRALRDKGRKTVVEAVFDASEDLKELFEANGLDWDTETIIRREISPSGRSRSFVNDTPVNLKLLEQVTSGLIDIHSQNENRRLSLPATRLQIIDAMADNEKELTEYRKAFRDYASERSKLRNLQSRIEHYRENLEYNTFRLEQLRKLQPREGELERLEAEVEMLSDAEDISRRFGESLDLLDGGEESVISSLDRMRHSLSKVNLSLFEKREADNPGICARIESAFIELKDIAAEIEGFSDSVKADPARLAKDEQRISDIYDMMRRYDVDSEGELVAEMRNLERSLAETDSENEDLTRLQQSVKEKGKRLKKAAEELTDTRRNACALFSTRLVEAARPLGMANLKFSAMPSIGKLTIDGQDEVRFLCSFNKNQELMPVEGAASGGETSRLMLSIKAIIARKVNLPSIVFDEVDTGVSGEIADRMGEMMRRMASDIQVVAITHLPQVAAKGDLHFKVFKKDEADQTITHIKCIDKEERIECLASMLAGSHVDEAALLNARSLLEANKSESSHPK